MIITLVAFAALTTAALALDARRPPQGRDAVREFMYTKGTESPAPAADETSPAGVQAAAAAPSFDPRSLALLRDALSPAALEGLAPALARERALAWLAAVPERKKKDSQGLLASILPPAEWFQARLIMERDEPTLRGDALTGGAYGAAYKDILGALKGTRASAPALEATLTAIWSEKRLGDGLVEGIHAPLVNNERWLPTNTTLAASHRYALDIFFTKVRRKGAEEIGPVIRSMSSGIVVAASGDWNGSDRASQYRSGGLSPKAGNGVIVFSPELGSYFVYFHLHDLSVEPGQIVAAGQSLGHGGNTGVNARKKGHGQHLHVEIHESNGKVWTSQELKTLLAGL